MGKSIEISVPNELDNELDRVYQAIGQMLASFDENAIASQLRSHSLNSLNQVNFAKKSGKSGKGKKLKNCSKGYRCGYSCINKDKGCSNPLDGQGKDFADYLDKVGGGSTNKKANPPTKTSNQPTVDSKNTDSDSTPIPLTPTQAVQPVSDHKLFGNQKSASIKKVAEVLGVSRQEATQMAKGIEQYTKAKYAEIRAAERGDIQAKPEIQQHIDGINSYLEKAPKYDGQIYRGLSFATAKERDAFLQKVQTTGGWVANSMDSWSSNRSVSEGFAGKGGPGPYGVLISTRNKSGASIRQLSFVAKEDEVLAGKGTRYRVTGSPQTGLSHGGDAGDYTLIEVEDLGAE